MNRDKEYTIFKDNYGKYKIGLSHKTTDGKTEYAYFPVHFKKSVELENRAKIRIKAYWLDFYNWEYQGKKGTSFYIFINSFEELYNGEQPKIEEQKKEDPYESFSQEIEITDDMLPF